jgi:hypothetical protein
MKGKLQIQAGKIVAIRALYFADSDRNYYKNRKETFPLQVGKIADSGRKCCRFENLSILARKKNKANQVEIFPGRNYKLGYLLSGLDC